MLGTKRKTALLGSASAVALLVAAAPTQAQTEVEISGYVKGDLIYDIGEDIGDSANMSAIALDDSTGVNSDETDAHFRAHAKQTRIRLQTSTDTPMGDLKTYVEGDFFGPGGNQLVSNSNGFRLRHAYGSLGPLLVGKTWSNFTRFHYPATMDFFGPQGALFKRQAQARYTFDAGPNLSVSFSIENAENFAISTGGASLSDSGGSGIAVDELPDFVLMSDYNAGGTSMSLGGILRKLAIDTQVPGGADDTDLGWGVHLGVSQQVLGRDTVYGEITYGEGITSYMNGVVGSDSIWDGSSLHAVERLGFVLGATHVWSDTAESNIAWGRYRNFDTPEDFAAQAATPANSTDLTDSVHVNYMWHPVPRVTFGVEYIYGRREVSNPSGDDNGDHHRIHVGAQYRF